MIFGRLGWLELVLIVGVILIIFGPGKLGGLTRSLVGAVRGFKQEVNNPEEKPAEDVEEEEQERPVG